MDGETTSSFLSVRWNDIAQVSLPVTDVGCETILKAGMRMAPSRYEVLTPRWRIGISKEQDENQETSVSWFFDS